MKVFAVLTAWALWVLPLLSLADHSNTHPLNVIDRVGVRLTRQASGYGERIIPQGANVAPNGDRLEVTSKCLRLNGRALIPVMGEIHYSRAAWAGRIRFTSTVREPVRLRTT